MKKYKAGGLILSLLVFILVLAHPYWLLQVCYFHLKQFTSTTLWSQFHTRVFITP